MTGITAATETQRATLSAVIRWGSTKAAADKLRVPEKTVRSRLSALYRRIGVGSIAQAAYALGLEGRSLPQ